MSIFSLADLVKKAAELQSTDGNPRLDLVRSRVEMRITFLMCMPSDRQELNPVFGPQHVGQRVGVSHSLSRVNGCVVRFLNKSTPREMWDSMSAQKRAEWEDVRRQRLLGRQAPNKTAFELFSASSNLIVSVDPKVGGTVVLQSGTQFENPLLGYDGFLTEPRTAQGMRDRAALYDKWEADCTYVKDKDKSLTPSLGFVKSVLDEYERSASARAMYTPVEWSRLARRLFTELQVLGSSCSRCNYLEDVTKLISRMFASTCPIKADSSREKPPKCFYTQSKLRHLKHCKRRLAAMVDDDGLLDGTDVLIKRANEVLLSAKKTRKGVAKRWQSKGSKEKAKYDATDRYAELDESDKVAVENWAKLAEDMSKLSSSWVNQLGTAFRKAMPLSTCRDEIETGIGLRTKDVDRHELDEYLDGKKR